MQIKLLLLALFGLLLKSLDGLSPPHQVDLGEDCELSDQCQRDPFAVCDLSQNRCVCKEGFEHHQGNCLGLLDSSCSNNTQCEHIGASICLPQAMKCACIQGYVPNQDMTTCVGLGSNFTSAANPLYIQLWLLFSGICWAFH